MSYQNFISTSNDRSNRSSSGSSLPLCSLYSGDRRAQQALYMGCPSNYNQVSFSPSEELGHQVTLSSPSSSIPFQPLPTLPHTCSSTPRIMYPTLNYSQGNPGFYYDLMQNPRSVTKFYGGIVFFPLYQARKYVLTSWYCNSFCLSFILSHGVLFFISVLRHYPSFAHPCY